MSNDINTRSRPRLARGVRYRWDEVRRQHQLLYPEGMLVLNDTAASIIQLVDGRSVEGINLTLSQSHPDADLRSDVDKFLGRLMQRGLIRDEPDA